MNPQAIKFHKQSQTLELVYNNTSYHLSAEFLRVHSPSAEVRGHGPDQAVLQAGKQHVKILKLEPQGNYALRIHFDDGHDTGLYSWAFLHTLCGDQARLWQTYLEQLNQASLSRDPDTSAVKFIP
ncbi:DUF971 domain-containing protein [Halioxenophilus aromaticivorans]|uniref:DUF971 domain-containing protein n=1 Tax=Halioxenophilus aromaticivorans TaxID=1306992 RepID=A0AAV3U2W4_9ALTE